MQLSVYVLGREVATLEQVGDFKSVLNYHPRVAADDFVSLTMPVRAESYIWNDQLPPVLQMMLGLRPAAKYDTTWERIARAVRDHVPGPQRLQTYRQLDTG